MFRKKQNEPIPPQVSGPRPVQNIRPLVDEQPPMSTISPTPPPQKPSNQLTPVDSLDKLPDEGTYFIVLMEASNSAGKNYLIPHVFISMEELKGWLLRNMHLQKAIKVVQCNPVKWGLKVEFDIS